MGLFSINLEEIEEKTKEDLEKYRDVVVRIKRKLTQLETDERIFLDLLKLLSPQTLFNQRLKIIPQIENFISLLDDIEEIIGEPHERKAVRQTKRKWEIVKDILKDPRKIQNSDKNKIINSLGDDAKDMYDDIRMMKQHVAESLQEIQKKVIDTVNV